MEFFSHWATRKSINCHVSENWPRENGNKQTRELKFSQFSSVAQSCPTPCDPMNCSMPGLPVHHQLPEFTQTPMELTVLSQNEAGQTTNDQVQDVCQSWLCCVCMKSPPSVYKSSCPLVVMGWQGESQPLDRSLPPLPIAGIQNKANFPFEERAATPLWLQFYAIKYRSH